MPQVDLTAILPALKEAVEPFEKALAPIGSINPATRQRAYAPLGDMPIGRVMKLVEAVQAVRRMAGDY